MHGTKSCLVELDARWVAEVRLRKERGSLSGWRLLLVIF